MAQFNFLFIFLIIALFINPNMALFSTSKDRDLATASVPLSRKLLKKNQETEKYSSVSPCLSPSEAPQSKEMINSLDQAAASSQEILKKHHRPFDKSVAGGGVILGGLATTFFIAVFCYIRATGRKNNGEPPSP